MSTHALGGALSFLLAGGTIAVAADACTSVSELVHLIALSALADRVRVAPVDELV